MSRAEPRFDLDLRYGQEAETRIRELLDWVVADNGQCEVKRKRFIDLSFYVETHCDRGRTGIFQPSGINTTTSAMWFFVIEDTGIHVAFPTMLLRELALCSSSQDKEEQDGSCPTRGKLINLAVALHRYRQRMKERATVPVKAVLTQQVTHADPKNFTADDINWGDSPQRTQRDKKLA